MTVRDLLVQLKAEIVNQSSVETIGAVYQALEKASIAYPVTGVSKPFMLQLMRVWLMQQFTDECLRVSSGLNTLELNAYSVTDTIDEMVLKIDQS